MQKVHRFVSRDFAIRVATVNALNVVQEMQNLQNMKPIPAVGVGQLMIGMLLMASHLREGQQIGALIKGDGALNTLFAEASFDGKTRGYTPHAGFDPGGVLATKNSICLREFLGSAWLQVTRHQPFQKQPHHGTVAMVHGEVDLDLTGYLKQSQQISGHSVIEVGLSPSGQVTSAGGVLIEVMPGVDRDLIKKIEESTTKNRDLISNTILAGGDPYDLVGALLSEIEYSEIDHNYPIQYHCQCNKDRVMTSLAVLGIEGLEEILAEGKTSDITCQMCGRPYQISIAEITEVRDKLKRESLH